MRNQMTCKQLLSLARYLETNRDRLHAERPGYATVARRASAELGFRCTRHNVRTVAEACALAWVARAGDRGLSSPATRRILARAMMEIAAALEVPVDRRLRHLALGGSLVKEAPGTPRKGLKCLRCPCRIRRA